jgi:hypothetical protein
MYINHLIGHISVKVQAKDLKLLPLGILIKSTISTKFQIEIPILIFFMITQGDDKNLLIEKKIKVRILTRNFVSIKGLTRIAYGKSFKSVGCILTPKSMFGCLDALYKCRSVKFLYFK